MSRPKITLKQLEMLVALGEELHFRRAAERCGVSQPSLSAQIQGLEEELTLTLVERARKGALLTPAGREVVSRGRAVLDSVQGIADFAAEARRGPSGTIRLGAKPTLGPYILPHVVARLHRDHPDLRLYIRESTPRSLEQELARGVHDIILAQLPISSSEFSVQRLFREPLYLAFAADHPLARFETIQPRMLEGLEVLSLSPTFHLHDQIVSLCQDFGATLLRDYEGTSLDAVRQMVGMGMGATFLPALYIWSEITDRSEIVVRPLEGKAIYRSVGLVWRKSAGRVDTFHQIARLIRTVAKEEFSNLIVET